MTHSFSFFTLKSLPLSAALALALASGALAQETAAPATDQPAAPAENAAPAQPAPDDGLSMGQEAADGIGANYVQAEFDAWQQRCVRTEDGSDPCQLYQLLKDEQDNAVAEFSMFNLPPGGQAVAGATVIVPLETLLTENLQLAIDGSKAKVYPFTFCSQIGCIARIGFTAAEVEQFKKGAKASLTIVPAVAPDQKVVVNLSLKGFTAGFTAVSATNP